MSKPILDPVFWAKRLADAKAQGELHRSVFHTVKSEWDKICDRHRCVLRDVLDSNASILDVGCGYGGLLELLPDDWYGEYIGIDISRDLLDEAVLLHPKNSFWCHDIREPLPLVFHCDVAIMRSIRQMVIGNLGEGTWVQMRTNIEAASTTQIYLEYT